MVIICEPLLSVYPAPKLESLAIKESDPVAGKVEPSISIDVPEKNLWLPTRPIKAPSGDPGSS